MWMMTYIRDVNENVLEIWPGGWSNVSGAQPDQTQIKFFITPVGDLGYAMQGMSTCIYLSHSKQFSSTCLNLGGEINK